MTKLTKTEKTYNKWWLSRFDDNYKTICLFNGNKKIQEYTTANKRYSDQEDTESALVVAGWKHLVVTAIEIDGKKFKVNDGKAKRDDDL